MDQRLTRLAVQVKIPPGLIASRLGVSPWALALLDRGHATLKNAQVRVIARRLWTTETKVREAMGLPPEPRSADMQNRLALFATLFEQVQVARPFDRSKIDRIAAECFPDEHQRQQVTLDGDPPRWKVVEVEVSPIDEDEAAEMAADMA